MQANASTRIRVVAPVFSPFPSIIRGQHPAFVVGFELLGTIAATLCADLMQSPAQY